MPIKPAVAVIIPAYNRLDFIEEAVSSVLSQSFQNLELIVVDDGSTDGTGDLVRERFDDERLKVYSQDNLGVSAARNRGVNESSAPLVAFLDSDDYWLEEKLTTQLLAMEKDAQRISYTGEVWYRRGKWANPCSHHEKHSGDIFSKCLPLCIISPSSVLMERSLFEEVGGFDETLPACEDYDLWLRISARCGVLFCPEKLIVKRNGHEGQLSQEIWGLDRFRIAALWKLVYDSGIEDDKRREALRWIVKKSRVVAGGAKKRGALERAQVFERSRKEAESWLMRLER